MAEAEISAFLSDLAVAKKVSNSTQNQALSAILFQYKEVLNNRSIGSITFLEQKVFQIARSLYPPGGPGNSSKPRRNEMAHGEFALRRRSSIN
jgi:Phage integrase, N-terminal SAM-like domain